MRPPTIPDRPDRQGGRAAHRALVRGIACLLLPLLLSAPTLAQRAERPTGAGQRRLLDEAAAALQGGDPTTAQALYERAYRLAPAPGLLLPLGRVARAQGQTLLAADLFRRYLEEAEPAMGSGVRDELQRFLQGATGPSDEVAVFGEDGGLVLLDGRLVGSLPLPLPLRVAIGSHRIGLLRGGQRAEAQVELLVNRPVEVRFTLLPPLAVVTPTAAAVLIAEYGGAAGAHQQALVRAASQAAAEERVLVLPRERLAQAATASGLDGCRDTLPCQERLASRVEAPYLLQIRAAARERSGKAKRDGMGDWRLAATLHDVAAGAAAARAEEACAGCELREVGRRLSDLVGRVVREGVTRPRGVLEVAAQPSGARVLVDGRELGTAPLRRVAFAGRHQVRIEQPGYEGHDALVTVENDRVARVEAVLRTGAEPTPACLSCQVPPPRPLLVPPAPSRGRAALRWTMVGLGVAQILAGATLWGLDGTQRCDKAAIGHCHWEFNGEGAGAALLVGGGVSAGIAGVLFYLDARRQRRETRLAAHGATAPWLGGVRR